MTACSRKGREEQDTFSQQYWVACFSRKNSSSAGAVSFISVLLRWPYKCAEIYIRGFSLQLISIPGITMHHFRLNLSGYSVTYLNPSSIREMTPPDLSISRHILANLPHYGTIGHKLFYFKTFAIVIGKYSAVMKPPSFPYSSDGIHFLNTL